ncbi:MAG: hypothetical protein NT154_08400 [Verrucomicrobia bacterium]|nr:hypothetical protein [Verrucomicrobiota bacterium]
MKVAAYSDLGGLGTRQGPSVSFVWRMPNILPVLLPWLAVLVLLALPSNRNPRAWWIWAPLIGLALLGAGLDAAAEAASEEEICYSVQTAGAAAFGLATLWLLGSALARRCRALAITFIALAYATISLLAFIASPVWEQMSITVSWDSESFWYLLLFWVVSGVVFAGALNLTGRICRRRFSRTRVSLWLPIWLWVMWMLAGSVVICVERVVFGGYLQWRSLLVVPIVLSLVSFAVILPFLILSFCTCFYRERFKDLLRLPAVEAAPPAPPPPVPSAEHEAAGS